MTIVFNCKDCSQTLRVPDDAQGKTARCPTCSELTTVPSASSSQTPPSTPAPTNTAPPAPGLAAGASLFDEPVSYPQPVPPKTQQLPNQNFVPPGAYPAASPYSAANPYPTASPYPQQPYPAPQPYQTAAPAGYYPPIYAPAPPRPRHRLADRGKRFVGAILDGIITALGIIPGFLIVGMAVETRNHDLEELGSFLILGGMFFITIINWVMISFQGQSIAKKLLGMRIVRETSGQPPGFFYGVILRVWIPALLGFCYLFHLLDALFIFGEERKCLHDQFAGTIVIDTNR